MPEVRPQSLNQPRTGNVLDRIKPVSSEIRPIKLAIYGETKTGKTRLACTFPKPLLIIGFEDGTESIVGIEGVDFVQLIHTDEITPLITHVRSGGKYKSVVLDNGTRMRDMKIAEYLGLSEIPQQKHWGFMSREQYGAVGIELKRLLNPLLDLPRLKPIHVVVIAQEANLNSDDGTSTLVKPKLGPALGKSLAQWISAECSFVCETFIRPKIIEEPILMDGKQIGTQPVRTNEWEYCLRVGPNDLYYTGFRQALGAAQLPELIVNPSYEKIVSVIRGTQA
jgi:hypothetical protein